MDILYDYLVYTLRSENSKEIMDAADELEKLLPREQYIELEPNINLLISAAEMQGFTRIIQLFVNTQIKTASNVMDD